MSYGMTPGALSSVRTTRLRVIFALAVTAAALLSLSMATSSASAAFAPGSFSLTPSSLQAGGHPAITLSTSNDAAAADLNGDDLRTLQFDLPQGMLVNPQAIPTPCPTATFDANAANCAASTQVGTIAVTYRVPGKLYTSSGTVYSITPDSNSVINFGFVVSPTTTFQKFLFKSGKATGLTTVRPDYGLSILVPNIPRTIKSTLGLSTAMTISNVSITLNSRAGASQTSGPYFTFAPTRCAAANAKVTQTSYAGVTGGANSAYVPTGCDKIGLDPTYSLSTSNTNAGLATGLSATVTMPTGDAAIQQSHISDVKVVLQKGTTINLGTLNALGLCSDAQLSTDTCPASSKMGTATVNTPFLPAAMTGEIYLTSRETVQWAFIVRGARGTSATVRGSTMPGSNGLESTLTGLPQVPWSNTTLNFTSLVLNNPVNSCPNAISWAYVNGYSGAQFVYGTLYPQTNCPPDTTFTATPGTPGTNKTPTFSFASNPTGAPSYQCSVDNAYFTACASPYTVPAVNDGTHTFEVRALNSNGIADPTPASFTFVVDTVKPAISIDSPAEGATLTSNNVTIKFTTEPGTTNYCRLDAGALPDCSGKSSLTYTNLADGPHKFRLISRDDAGNLTFTDRNFTVAVPKTPVISLTSPANGGTQPTNRVAPIFTVTSPNGTPITSVTCHLFFVYYTDPVTGETYDYEDRAPFACNSGDELRFSEQDKFRLEVTAVDSNGLSSVATTTFTTGIAPPYAPSVAEQDRLTNLSTTERTPTFHLDGGDNRWPDTQVDCSLTLASAAPVWNSCGSESNPDPVTVTTPLANGAYVLKTRARSGSVTGDTYSMAFTVGDWSSTYTATTTTTQAGAHPDLDIDITPTGAGQMKSVDMTLPKSLIGSLNSFPSCSDIVKAICPAATKIGTVDVDYTIYGAISLRRTPGDVYFTGPQVAGDAAGLVIRVYGPVAPYADVIIPLRIQLLNNSQTMRVFSDNIPTDVGDIYDPTRFIRYWVKDFKMHVNGSTGSPFPLLTNPSACTAGQFSNITGPIEGAKTAAQTIPYTATGCSTLPFAPTLSQEFSSTEAGTNAGVTADVNLPLGNSSFKTLRVTEPAAFAPNYPAFGTAADQCPSSSAPLATSTFDATNCPASSIVGTMSIESPLLTRPLNGTVYLINKSPLPWLGVKLDDTGVAVRLLGITSLPQVDSACDSSAGFCQQQIAISFSNIPDLPVTRIRMTIDGPTRTGTGNTPLAGQILTIASPTDAACTSADTARTVFTPSSGNPISVATQTINFSGCTAG